MEIFAPPFPLHLLEHRKRSYSALFCVLRENKNSRFRLEIRSLLLFAFLQSGATRNRTGDTRIFSNKLINNEMIVYQLDICILSFMVNAVEKTKVVFKLILNLSITICIGTCKVLNFLFLLHNCFCYIAQ